MAYVEVPPVVIETSLALVCDGEYHDLDFPAYVPEFDASTDADVYLNIAPPSVPGVATGVTLTINGVAVTVPIELPGVGRLRIRMVRDPWNGDPADPTYYYDIALHDGMGWLDTRTMFEEAEAGRGVKWQYRVEGAAKVTLKTRFVKYRQVLGKVAVR
jgi:hypothetical protein